MLPSCSEFYELYLLWGSLNLEDGKGNGNGIKLKTSFPSDPILQGPEEEQVLILLSDSTLHTRTRVDFLMYPEYLNPITLSSWNDIVTS